MSAIMSFANSHFYSNAQPSVFNSPSSSTYEEDELAPSPSLHMGPPRASPLAMDEVHAQMRQSASGHAGPELRQVHLAGSGRGQFLDVPIPINDAGPSATIHKSPGLQRHRSATTVSEPAYSGSARLAQHQETYDDISSRLGVDPQLDWIVQLISDKGKASGDPSAPQQHGSAVTTASITQSHLQRASSGQSMSEHLPQGEFREGGYEGFASLSPVTPTDAQFMSYAAAHELSALSHHHAASGLPASPGVVRSRTSSGIDGTAAKPTAPYPSRPLSSFVRRATMSTTPQQALRDARASTSSMTSFRLRTEESREIAPACDFCRRRKVKCDRQQPQCTFCIKHGIVCTQNDQLRKRGPPTKDQRMALERAGLRYDRSRRKLMPMSASSPCLSRSSQPSAASATFSEGAAAAAAAPVAGPSVLSASYSSFLEPSRSVLVPSPTSPLAPVPQQEPQQQQQLQSWTSQQVPVSNKAGAPLRAPYLPAQSQRSPRYAPYPVDGMSAYGVPLDVLSEEQQREMHHARGQVDGLPLSRPFSVAHDWHNAYSAQQGSVPNMKQSPRQPGLLSPVDDHFRFAATLQAASLPPPPQQQQYQHPQTHTQQQQLEQLLHPHYRSPRVRDPPSMPQPQQQELHAPSQSPPSSHSSHAGQAPQHWSSS